DVENILTFKGRYADVVTTTLADNFRSSPGVVSVGRSIAQLNDPNRLTKEMAAKSHQTYERGDILALEFGTPADEAAWICDRIEQLRGAPFVDAPGEAPRGLSWSDFAVLFRSVQKS